jgi:Family of unknown function (DUF6074)
MRRQREPSRESTRATLREVSARPSATILAFPIAARRDLVDRIVAQMLARSASEAEECLRQHVMCQERTLFRKRVPPETIARELERLASRFRAKVHQKQNRQPVGYDSRVIGYATRVTGGMPPESYQNP